MGNCQSEEIISIKFKFENKDIILQKKTQEKINKIKIINNIEETNENKDFINLINKIYSSLDQFSNDHICVFKMAIKQILDKICNKDNINKYINTIENINKNKYNLDEIINLINLFKFIYSNNAKLDNYKIIYFIETINTLFKEAKIIDENELESFVDHLKNIFQSIPLSVKNKENKLQNQNNKQDKKEDISKLKTNAESVNNKKDKEKDMVSNIDNSFIKNLERKESKSSAFSKYSESSQHQIKKMEEEREKNIKLIKSLMEGMIEKKKIIFYNEKENKEYPLTIPNKVIQFENIVELLYLNYPNLKRKLEPSYTYKGEAINLEKEIDIEENDKIIFEYYN